MDKIGLMDSVVDTGRDQCMICIQEGYFIINHIIKLYNFEKKGTMLYFPTDPPNRSTGESTDADPF